MDRTVTVASSFRPLAILYILSIPVPALCRSTAREEAELLARAGEARFRLALLRRKRVGDAGGSELADAIRSLEEARELDPANLRALAFLGLARLEAARRPREVVLDTGGFSAVREPFEELFKLSHGSPSPATHVILREVSDTLDRAFGHWRGEAAAWWRSWRERVAPSTEPKPPAAEVLGLIEDLRSAPAAWQREGAAVRLAETGPPFSRAKPLRRGEAPKPEVAEALARALREDDSPWVRAAAACALRRLHPAGWDVRLAEALKNDKSVWVRRTCAEELGVLPEECNSHFFPGSVARKSLLHALSTDTPRVASAAARALAMRSDAGEALSRAIRVRPGLVRKAAALALSQFGIRKADVAREIALLLVDPRADIRAAAATALGGCNTVRLSEAEREKFLDLLGDPDATVRAAAALRASDERLGPSARARLEKLLEDADPRVRLAAARNLLGAPHEAAEKAVQSVVDSTVLLEVGDDSSGVRTVGDAARETLEILARRKARERNRP